MTQPTSDLAFNLLAFDAALTHPSTTDLSHLLIEKKKEDVKWWEVGAAEYRKLRAAGKTPFPPTLTIDENTCEILVPSSFGKHQIPCRVFEDPTVKSRGIYLHIHGGGWTLGSAKGQDLLLHYIAREAQLTVVSIEYRLAPEHPFPAGGQDCQDVADWVVRNGRSKWATDLKFLGGESAGATLAASLLIYLRDSGQNSTLVGSVLNYGCYDLGILPSARDTTSPHPILEAEDAAKFTDCYLAGMSLEERKSGKVSPLYNDMKGLGSALFIVGTDDVLIDDTVLMSWRFARAGNEACVKFLNGAAHGFMVFDGRSIEVVKEGWEIMLGYLKSKL